MSIVNPNPLYIYEPLLLGKTIAVATSIAAKKGIDLFVKRDEKSEYEDIILMARPNRLNVEVAEGIVTKLLYWG